MTNAQNTYPKVLTSTKIIGSPLYVKLIVPQPSMLEDIQIL
jgi:hypothetical protein